LVRRRPALRKIAASDCDNILEYVAAGSEDGMWTRLSSGVDALPWSGTNISRCPFWNPDLQRIRTDLNRMRRIRKRFPVVADDHHVIRRVYFAMLVRSPQEFIQKMIEEAEDPAIFNMARQLESRRTLLSMINSTGDLVCRYADISDLIAAQLGPGDEEQ